MSITSWLLLFLLLFSLHACNARRLGGVDKKLEKKYQYSSIKNDEKKGYQKTSVLPAQLKASLSEEAEASKRDGIKKTRHQTQKDSKAVEKISKDGRGKTSGAALTSDSSVSVSWRVPHKKRRERHPGFNLDYSPPKTHPPSHN